MHVTVKLSKEEVEALIKDHLHKKGYVAKKVDFKVSSHEEGDQRDPYTVTAFTGVEVDSERES